MLKRKLISVLFEILKDKDNYLGDTEPDEDEELNIDSSETDLSEKAKVNTFYSNTPVQMWGGCNWGITISDVLKNLNNCLELSSTELDFVTLGAIQRSVNCSDVSASGRTEKNCKLLRMSFFFHGKKICRKTFLFLHFIRKSKFCSLVKHYWDNGVSLRIHGNKEGSRSERGLQLFLQKLLKKFWNM